MTQKNFSSSPQSSETNQPINKTLMRLIHLINSTFLSGTKSFYHSILLITLHFNAVIFCILSCSSTRVNISLPWQSKYTRKFARRIMARPIYIQETVDRALIKLGTHDIPEHPLTSNSYYNCEENWYVKLHFQIILNKIKLLSARNIKTTQKHKKERKMTVMSEGYLSAIFAIRLITWLSFIPRFRSS